MKAPYLSVVAPCHNEDGSIAELHRRMTVVCQSLVGNDYELILVNDGSRDRTWPQMLGLSEQDPHVVAVNLTRNHGHQLALTAGLHICRGERILIIDADLQDPPELLGAMMQAMDDGADVVYGQRIGRSGETLFKRVSAGLFYRLLNTLVDTPIPVDSGDFRLISRRVLDLLNGMPERHRFLRGMISWVGFRQVPLQYERQKRFAGETKYPLRKMIRLALDAVTGFSIKPLRITTYLGLIFAALGSAALLYTLYSWAVFGTVQGWASVMTAVLVLGSVQLLMLGLFGEYLGRLFVEVKQRPLFLIETVVRSDEQTYASKIPPAYIVDSSSMARNQQQ